MRKKKKTSLLIVITMLLMIIAPMPAVAEPTNWADYAATASAPDDYEVSGDVYTIKTATGLAWLASQVNGGGNAFSGMTVQLSGDIDLSAHEWTPIGNGSNSFSGTFDGSNYKISGLAIGSESNPNTTLGYIGLFGEVWPQGGGGSTPEIKNLTIETSGIYSDRTGKIFAEIGILAGRTKATITNCKVSGNVVGTNSYLGGLVGAADGPVNISECSAAGNITLTADAGICGGLIGYGNSIDISKSYAAVGVTYTGDNYAGGLVGHLENINSKVSYCYATGNVVVQPGPGSGQIYACGGLVGFLRGQLLHCYARGDVSGNNKYTGGLIGESNGSVMIGYATGKVTCDDDSKRGAVIGYSRGSSSTYWNDEVYEGANQGIGNNPSPDQNISTGKQQADMQSADFAGLLNSDEPTPVWKYVSGVNDGYPVLIGVGDGTASGGSTGPTVTLTGDSAGTAGYQKITGLTEGKIYKVTVDPEGSSPVTMYTQADGSLTANEDEKEALGDFVTAITGLTNGTTYKVEEYNTPPAGSEDYTITKSGNDFQVAGAGTYATLAAALAVCTDKGADDKLVIKLGDGSNPLELNACKNSDDNNLKDATYIGKVNFTITSNTTDGFTIPNGITATFKDLAITTSVDSPPFSAIKIMQGGTLNIEEGTSITPHFALANPRMDLIANVGELNINGGTITGDDNTGLLIRNNGILKASGGTITTSATGNYGIAISSVAGGNITVSGNAVVSAPKSGIAAEGSQSADQIVINGGTVEATDSNGIAIMTRGAKVDVTAGTVRSTGTSSWACAIGDISSNVINNTITISGGAISCAGDTAIRVGNTSLGTVNVSGGTIKSAGDKTLLLFKHASTPDNAKFVVHGVSIYRHNEAFVSIKGVVDPADNNNRVLTGANKNDATVTAINIASGKSFIGWMSDSARAASISTTNGATITSLTTGDNAAVSDIYLKVGVLVSAPTVLPTAGSFTDTDNDANQIGGSISWTAANPATGITGYKIYWGSNASTKLAGNSAVVYTVAGAASTSQAVADNTDLPAGATHFLIYSYNAGGDSASCLAIAIADGGPAQAVTLAAGSLGAAGDGKITNLTSGSKYKVSIDGAIKYVKADGTLSDNEADAAALIGTEIIGLTNGKNYMVEEYTGGAMNDADAVAGAKAALDESDITYASGDSKTSVTSSFTLPLTGENGTTITWTENPESSAVSIDAQTGVVTVTRPASASGDASVTLRATITRNDQSDTKDLTVIVKQQTVLKLTVPDFSIENQTIAEGTTKQITLAATGSKLILNGVEQAGANITYSYAEIVDAGNITKLSGSTLTLVPPADGSVTVKIKATATWTEGGNTLAASRIVSFTVSKQGNLPCSCIVTTPAFNMENQTIPYNEDKVINLNASGAKLIGNCQKPGHAVSQINYSYTLLSGNLDSNGASIASISGNQLTLNPTIAGTYTITIQAMASANNKTAGKSASFTVTKQPSPPVAQCTCSISAPTLSGGNITIAAGENNATLDLSGQLTAATLNGGCQVPGHAAAAVNHIYAIKSGNSSCNTAGASINGRILTVTRAGKVTVIVIASANGKISQTAEATYNVSNVKVSAVETSIDALPIAGTDTPSTDDTIINNASTAILAAKTAFENLSMEEKEQVNLAKRNKLDTLINRLGVLQTSIDASQAGATVTAVGLATAVNTTNDINAGSKVNITLAVQAEANSSHAEDTAADSNLIIAGAGSNPNLSSAFDVRLIKTVTENSGNVTTESVSEADAPVYVTLEVPVSMRGGTDYKVYHVHTRADGTKELETIEATYNANANPPSISFWISKFSTIKIGYSPASLNPSSPGGGSSSPLATVKTSDFGILVNGKTENMGTAITTKIGNQTVTNVVIDEQKLEARLNQEGNNVVVTIPVNTKADEVIGELNGQMVKNLETKQAVVEVKTEKATYTLPAQQINIDAITAQLGQAIALKEIKVQIAIAKPASETVKVVEKWAAAGGFTIVASPVEFNVQCSFGGKTVSVNSFNAYVERTIAIPEGADPNKITTGVAVEADGSIRHVPTQVIKMDNKYYAKINSLTNSTYAVVWHPLEFQDVNKHWAKTAVNDMGSRMVVSGVNKQSYEPDRDITRAEFATVIVKALGLKPGSGQGQFSDVSDSVWYSGYIQTASAYKIISGYGSGKFGPTDKISREQAMTMIAKAMNITGLKVDFQAGDAEKLLTEFADADKSAEYACKSISACIKTGIISGKSGNMLAPKDAITRAEVAVIVQKLLQKSKLI